MSFNYNKKWYTSKSVLAGIFTLAVAIVGSMYGEASVGVAVLTAVGGALGIYGRAVATSKLE